MNSLHDCTTTFEAWYVIALVTLTFGLGYWRGFRYGRRWERGERRDGP